MIGITELKTMDVVPTPDNPRTFAPRGDDAFRSLVESVKAKGILSPLLVRPHPTKPGKYDLRAGERRLHAARAAGLESVPAIVREMTDQEALEITITENLQRDDLTPLEEAAGIASLQGGGWEIGDIAAQLGKSREWVVRRAKLCDLTTEWVDEVRNPGSPCYGWGPGHLDLVARLAPADQVSLLEQGIKWQFGPDMKLAELDKMILDATRLLKRAPWALDDATMPPGACNVCAENTACSPGLFGDYAEAGDQKKARCLNRKCWDAKLARHAERERLAAKEEHGPVLLVKKPANKSEAVGPLAKKAINDYRIKRVKKGTEGAKPAMMIEGPGAGKVFWAVPAEPARGHSAPGKAKKKKAASPKKRLRELDDQIRIFQWVACGELLGKVIHKLDYAAALAAMQEDAHNRMLGLAMLAGAELSDFGASNWAVFERVKKGGSPAFCKEAWKYIRWAAVCLAETGDQPDVEGLCEVFGLDVGALYGDAANSKPVKSLMAERAELEAEMAAAKAAKGAAKKTKKKATKKKARKKSARGGGKAAG